MGIRSFDEPLDRNELDGPSQKPQPDPSLVARFKVRGFPVVFPEDQPPPTGFYAPPPKGFAKVRYYWREFVDLISTAFRIIR